MDHAALVGRFERLGDLQEDRQCLLERQRATGDDLRERLAGDHLHHQERNRRPPLGRGRFAIAGHRRLEAMQRRDVRVVERSEDARLALEARQALGIGRERVGQDLDRHFAFEPAIARPVHLSHAARAENREDLVTPEDGMRRQHHGRVSRYGVPRSYQASITGRRLPAGRGAGRIDRSRLATQNRDSAGSMVSSTWNSDAWLSALPFS